ncbi:hypothetical protein [Parasphingorhabdus cellanae]|uniref:Uncharacterized protein n=1 Tax=Parasphingorhabdus cellanae TaxID=2806553 RepID=A0ABX7T1J1_9SPHN|nr:hypothetical protein [Parasphingorhabdus cellanae]QTD55426.1 hypothetical protein J4G78_14625 [Parasphingorhabdus cellanae]
MKTDKVDMQDLIENLEDILSKLDGSGHAIAAIKIEEAINALQRLNDERKNPSGSV